MTGAVLAIDFGTRRIGLAVTDADRRFTLPRDTLHRTTPAQDLLAIARLCEEESVTEVAVGLPLNVDGSEGPMAAAARAFGAQVATAVNLPVRFVDERYTSQEADEQLRERYPRDTRKRRSLRDRVAAVLILRTFLEHGPVE